MDAMLQASMMPGAKATAECKTGGVKALEYYGAMFVPKNTEL